MTETNSHAFATIRTRSESVERLMLTFSNGMKATFAKDHPAAVLCHAHAKTTGGNTPLGLIIQPPDRVVNLTWPLKALAGSLDHEVRMSKTLRESPRYKGYYLFGLGCYDGVYRLSADHPEFERIVATLKKAREDRSEVWVSHLRELLVLDVQFASAVDDCLNQGDLPLDGSREKDEAVSL